MLIKGIDGMTTSDLRFELQNGGKFVMFHYCISCLILTFRRRSDVYFVKAGESVVIKGLGYTLVTLLLGWWGFPWGFIYTIEAVIVNLAGGKDVTTEVIAMIRDGRLPRS
ncbi:MAG: hypothetical protein DWQ04_27635 [Chloroflexi bacterium]|nr:MAG: hypothetical protein DWQ04_27635 [Chloroflexota bacterium]